MIPFLCLWATARFLDWYDARGREYLLTLECALFWSVALPLACVLCLFRKAHR